MVKSYLAMLLQCACKPRRWRGLAIEPGQFVTSRTMLAQQLGVTVQQARTVVRRLVETGEITVQTSNQYTVITVCGWEEYQATGNQQNNPDFEQENGAEQPAQQPAINQRATNEQPAINHKQEGKESKEINNISPCACAQDENTPPPQPKATCLTFEVFWDMYGKKIDKEKCAKKFAKLPEKDREAILQVLPIYVASTPELQFRKNPYTWLNGKCWRDELQQQPERNPQQRQLTPAAGQVLHNYTFTDTESGNGRQPWEA